MQNILRNGFCAIAALLIFGCAGPDGGNGQAMMSIGLMKTF